MGRCGYLKSDDLFGSNLGGAHLSIGECLRERWKGLGEIRMEHSPHGLNMKEPYQELSRLGLNTRASPSIFVECSVLQYRIIDLSNIEQAYGHPLSKLA